MRTTASSDDTRQSSCNPNALPGASRRAAVIAAAHTALVSLFPTRQAALDASYAASLAALSDDDGDGGQSRERGIAWGMEVASAVLGWRVADGFSASYPPFRRDGGRPVAADAPAFGPMSAQGLAFTFPFVLVDSTQFQPDPPRTLFSDTYTEDFNTVKALGRRTGSSRTDEQTALAPFWEGNASVHWNQAANQIALANNLSMSNSNHLLAVLNIAMADTAFTIWSAKRHYGAMSTEVTWRPVTAIPLAGADGNAETAPDPDWLPLVTTPSHPEYPAGHPALNGAAATVLLRYFGDAQMFTLDDEDVGRRRAASPDLHQHLAGARRRKQRAGLGWDALPEHCRHQRRGGRNDCGLRQSERDATAPRPE